MKDKQNTSSTGWIKAFLSFFGAVVALLGVLFAVKKWKESKTKQKEI